MHPFLPLSPSPLQLSQVIVFPKPLDRMVLRRVRTRLCWWSRRRTTCGDAHVVRPRRPPCSCCAHAADGLGRSGCAGVSPGVAPARSARTGQGQSRGLRLQSEANVALELRGLGGNSREIRRRRSSEHCLDLEDTLSTRHRASTSPIFARSLLTPLQGGYSSLSLAAMNTSCAVS